MLGLKDIQRKHIIELLKKKEELPLDYKHLLFPPERQEYELVYSGKERKEDVLSETMSVPLQPLRSLGGNKSDRHNMLIFGDNLQAMKTLLKMKNNSELINTDGRKGVKLVYIDPPFASKQEFSGSQEERAYRDKIAGAQFIEFLRQRIFLIQELLSSNGSIFVHLDNRKVHYIKVILDEVFGEHNFRNEIILPGRASKNLQQQFQSISRLNVRHDTLLWYSKTNETRFSLLWVKKHNEGNPEGHWHHFWSTADRPTMRYELFGITPTSGQWTWKKERAFIAVENYKRYLDESGGRTLAEYWRDTGCVLEFIRPNAEDNSPQYWRPPSKTRLADTIWSGIPIYNNQTKYPTEKHESLLNQIIELASETGDVVLDAFAGSGTSLAVAEKLNRRWIGIDSGKLAIYTIQKRMHNLKQEIGNKGKPIKPKPFTLYNAGLYDFSKLKNLSWDDWRFFAMSLFQCTDEPHKVAGINLDGYRYGDDVLVFNHTLGGGVVLDYGFIDDLHAQIGSRVGTTYYLIAPAASVAFLEDYIDKGHTRYYILRIPYSIINELHTKDFEAIIQPIDENQVNEIVNTVGFDFIRTPKVECEYYIRKSKDISAKEAIIKINTFKSESMAKGAILKNNLETLSMVLVDYSYPYSPLRKGKGSPPPFELDKVFYAKDIEKHGWEIRLPVSLLGEYLMIIYIDIYGNEYTEIKTIKDFE